MDTAIETRPRALVVFLAGVQGGMLGALWMLVWLGLSATWQQRSFWTSENLIASAFYGSRAIHRGFAWETIAGTGLYLSLYPLLGGLLAMALGDRLPRFRTLLAGALFGLVWYYVSFHLLWKSVMPLVSLLHVERSTAIGHLIYGLWLGRYPAYLPRPAPPPIVEDDGLPAVGEPTPSPLQSSSEQDPASQSESF